MERCDRALCVMYQKECQGNMDGNHMMLQMVKKYIRSVPKGMSWNHGSRSCDLVKR